jgi:hypothetical protein
MDIGAMNDAGVGPLEGKPAVGGENVWFRKLKGVFVLEKLGCLPAGVGPREGKPFGAGVGFLEMAGELSIEPGNSDSAPDHRKPSKRPDIRISHSDALISERVARRL